MAQRALPCRGVERFAFGEQRFTFMGKAQIRRGKDSP
jgi:hypothetical protein